MEPIIIVKNISKKYNINHQQGGYITLRDIMTNAFKNPFKFLKKKTKNILGLETKEEFWALKNVAFKVMKGEVIGIIGKNGAGKSTLLKILSQITPPTTGEIQINGTVGSLLEVGTGFHPELTGRENIFLNGAILGMKKKDIIRKFDKIVKFADIEKFLDTPVKYYSSGMYVRLAFSVAAHMDTDILIIDEVLAVGDAEFQKKCLGKMNDITQKEGRTILFVSHNTSTIKNLCKKCLLLDKGQIIAQGETDKVLDIYFNEKSIENSGDSDLSSPSLRKNSNNNSLVKFNKITIVNSDGQNSGHIKLYEPFNIIIECSEVKISENLLFAFDIRSSLGITMFNSILDSKKLLKNNKLGLKKIGIQFEVNYLPPGSYIVGISVNGNNILDWIPNAISFSVEPISNNSTTLIDKFDGVVVHPHKWVNIN